MKKDKDFVFLTPIDEKETNIKDFSKKEER